MKKKNEQSIGEVIVRLSSKKAVGSIKLDELDVITEWDKVMGPTLAKYTEVFIKNKQLHIHFTCVLRQELGYKQRNYSIS